jgi:hypothetical protein
MGNCGSICENTLSKFKGDIIINRLLVEDNNNIIDEKSYEIQKVIYLQKKNKTIFKIKAYKL